MKTKMQNKNKDREYLQPLLLALITIEGDFDLGFQALNLTFRWCITNNQTTKQRQIQL